MWRPWFLRDRQTHDAVPQGGACPRCPQLEAGITELEGRLAQETELSRKRGELLYDLQRQYSSEHFDLARFMRDLNTEHLRNAGMVAQSEAAATQRRLLIRRIHELKARLALHEPVEEVWYDPVGDDIESSGGEAESTAKRPQ
ncbi:MAG: hypothetical protein ACYDHD_07870 [Vulcanimicrobiaceae bacterium]